MSKIHLQITFHYSYFLKLTRILSLFYLNTTYPSIILFVILHSSSILHCCIPLCFFRLLLVYLVYYYYSCFCILLILFSQQKIFNENHCTLLCPFCINPLVLVFFLIKNGLYCESQETIVKITPNHLYLSHRRNHCLLTEMHPYSVDPTPLCISSFSILFSPQM